MSLWGHWAQKRPHGQEVGFWGWKKKLNVNFVSYSTLLSGLMAIVLARNMSKSTITNKKDI